MFQQRPPRPAQMLGVRKEWARGPGMPSRGEGMRPSHRTPGRPGRGSWRGMACEEDTPPSSGASKRVLAWGSHGYCAHTPRRITPRLALCFMYIERSSKKSSRPAGTLGRSRAVKWRPNWALSKRPPYPSSPRRRNRVSTARFTISPTRIPRARKHPRSTRTSIARTFRALGARSPRSRCSSPACPRAHRRRCGMWQKRTERYLLTPGPVAGTRHTSARGGQFCD